MLVRCGVCAAVSYFWGGAVKVLSEWLSLFWNHQVTEWRSVQGLGFSMTSVSPSKDTCRLDERCQNLPQSLGLGAGPIPVALAAGESAQCSDSKL